MVELLTAKELAEKVGITPAELRKLLRKEFNRTGKTPVEGNRMEYRFDPNDPVVKQLMDKVKSWRRRGLNLKILTLCSIVVRNQRVKRLITMKDNATMPIGQAATHKPLVVGSNPSAAIFN